LSNQKKRPIILDHLTKVLGGSPVRRPQIVARALAGDSASSNKKTEDEMTEGKQKRIQEKWKYEKYATEKTRRV
jgi:hypothetical protein